MEIDLKDKGKNEGSASAGVVIAQIMIAITGATGKAVSSLKIGELTSGAMDAVKSGASGATEAVTNCVSGAQDTPKKGV